MPIKHPPRYNTEGLYVCVCVSLVRGNKSIQSDTFDEFGVYLLCVQITNVTLYHHCQCKSYDLCIPHPNVRHRWNVDEKFYVHENAAFSSIHTRRIQRKKKHVLCYCCFVPSQCKCTVCMINLWFIEIWLQYFHSNQSIQMMPWV